MKPRTFAWIALGVVLVAGNTALVLFLDRAPRPAPPGVGAGPAAPPPRETRVTARALPPGETPPPPAAFTIRVVVEDETGDPIPGARVRGMPRARGSAEVASATTGADGACALALPRRADWLVVAEAKGYGEASVRAEPDEVGIVLSPVGTILGRVVEFSTMVPVPGAVVEGPESLSTVSAADGSFSLPRTRFRAGDILRVRARGFCNGTKPLFAGTVEDSEIVYQLMRGGALRGRVTYAGTDRVAGEGTISWGAGPGDPDYTAPLGSDGRFVLGAVPWIIQEFRVETGGRVYRARGQKPVLDPKTGEQVGEIEVPLPPNSPSGLEFRGVVRDGEGNPVEGARVIVDADPISRMAYVERFAPDAWHIEATTDAEGRYRIVAEHPGNEILVLHPEYAPTHFVLPPRSYNRVFDLVLRRGATVVVKVRDAAGKPSPWAKVYTLMRHSDLAVAHIRYGDILGSLQENPLTEDDGTAVLGRLGPGTWYLCARSADGKEATRVVFEVSPNAGDLAVNLDLRTLPSIEGRLVDSRGVRVAGVGATILGERGILGALSTTTDADGEFRFRSVFLPPEQEGAPGVVVHFSSSRKITGADEHSALFVPFDTKTKIVVQDD